MKPIAAAFTNPTGLRLRSNTAETVAGIITILKRRD